VRRIPFVLATFGLVFLVIGVVIAFANSSVSQTIHCVGRIVESDEEMDAAENNFKTVDERGYIPVVVGIGLLSFAFLDERFRKNQK